MPEPERLESWTWSVRFSTGATGLNEMEPRRMWASIWARMAQSHRYISAPEISREVSSDGATLHVVATWRSMHEPEAISEKVLEQSSGCYLAWYKNVEPLARAAQDAPLDVSASWSRPINSPW